MIRDSFEIRHNTTVNWKVDVPTGEIREMTLSSTKNLFGPKGSILFDNVKNYILAASVDGVRQGKYEGTFEIQHHIDWLYVSFSSISFGKSISEPVKIGALIKKKNYKKEVLCKVDCTYDIQTKMVTLNSKEVTAESNLEMTSELEAFVCRMVKENMDIVFSNTDKTERFLIEILCQTENIELLGFDKGVFVSYEEDGYTVEIPLQFENLRERLRNYIPYMTDENGQENSMMECMNWIVKVDSSYLAWHFIYTMKKGTIKREKIVQKFQNKLKVVLKNAEEVYKMM